MTEEHQCRLSKLSGYDFEIQFGWERSIKLLMRYLGRGKSSSLGIIGSTGFGFSRNFEGGFLRPKVGTNMYIL